MALKWNVRRRRRRWAMLVAGLAAAAVLACGAYQLRLRQLDRRLGEGYAAGRAALAAGDYHRALHAIGAYVQRHDRDTAALYEYAQARERVEEPNGAHVVQAIRTYRWLLDLAPDHADARRRLLNLLLRSGLDAEALTASDDLLSWVPNDPTAHRTKAVALARLGRNAEALGAAERYNELASADLAGQVMTLQIMLRCGRTADDVRARAATMRAAHPGDAARFELLCSVAASMTGDATGAESWARRAAERGAEVDPDVAPALAQQLSVVGQLDLALAVLRRGADARPAAADAVAPLAGRLWEMGRWQEVEERVSAQTTAAASTIELLGLRATALAHLGRSAEAESLAAALDSRSPDASAAAWAQVTRATVNAVGGGGGGESERNRQRRTSSGGVTERQEVAVCEAALRLHPAHPYFSHFLGEAYARLGESELALEHWQTAARAAPAWSRPLTRTAEALVVWGRPAAARDVAQAAVRRNPGDPDARVVLARAWAASLASPEDARALLKYLAGARTVGAEASGHIDPGDGDDVLPARVAALAAAGERDAAIAAVRGALARPSAPSGSCLVRLAEAGRRAGLGIEEECFERCRVAHGLTTNLVIARAAWLLKAGRKDEGLRLVRAGLDGSKEEDVRVWRTAAARFLDLAGEAVAAREAWAEAVAAQPADLETLWSALASPSLADDRPRRGAILEALRAQVGATGMNWRLARAKFLLEGRPPPDQDLREATAILSDITRAWPELVSARLLLADALSKGGSTDAAVEQLAAVVHFNPSAVSASLGAAELLQSVGEFGRAREYLDGLLDGAYAGPEDRRAAAVLLARQGEPGRAISVFEQLLDGDDAKGRGAVRGIPALVLAALYRAQNQPDKAEAVYTQLLSDGPADPATVQEAAAFYAAQRRMDDARRVLTMLDAMAANDPAGRAARELVLGGFEARFGAPAVARQHFEAAVAADPRSVAAWRQLIALDVADGRPVEATRAIDRAAAALPTEETFLAARRSRELIAKLTPEAPLRPLILALLQPGDDAAGAAEALTLLATDGRAAGDVPPDPELARLASVADRRPRLLPLQNLVAEYYLGRRQFAEAAKVATRTMHLVPAAAEPARLAAEALAGAGRWDEALAASARWRDRGGPGKTRPADLMIASIHLARRRPELAAKQLEPHLAGARADPTGGLPVILLSARARMAAGQPDAAAGLVRPMLRDSRPCRLAWLEMAADPRLPGTTAAGWLGEVSPPLLGAAATADELVAAAHAWQAVARRTGTAEHGRQALEWRHRAERALNAAPDAAPAPPATVLALACLCDNDGDVAAAEGMYRRVLRLDPNAAVAMNNLAMLLVNREPGAGGGGLTEAARLAERAVHLAPSIPHFHDTLATIYLRRRSLDQAVKSLDTAVRLDPQSGRWRVRLATVLAEAGRPVEARAQLKEIDARDPAGAALPEADRARLKSLREELQARRG